MEVKPRIYYHPTTWALIDDQERFLRDMQATLPDHQLYKAFHEPADALETINRTNKVASHIPDRLTALYQDSGAEILVGVRANAIDQQILQPERMHAFSVVICDYLMPDINGLELFSRIDDSNVCKILLTGVGDEKLAIEAFNNGIIDRFVPKSHSDAINQVWTYARELQLEFFSRTQHSLSKSIKTTNNFLEQARVSEFVLDLVMAEGYVEFYYVHQGPGYLCLKSNGQSDQLLVQGERDVELSISYATSKNAPPHVIERLSKISDIGFFFESADDFSADEYDWESYLIPCQRVENTNYYFGWYPSPPIEAGYDPSIHSFDHVFEETIT